MPKKGKKGKGKGKGKKKGKGDKKGPPPPVDGILDDAIDETSRQFYTIQIQDLEGRLGRYQVKCDHLKIHNDILQKKLEQQLEDQEQITSYLKRVNQEQTGLCMDLEEKLAFVQQAKETQQEKLEGQITQLKEDSQRSLDQAAVENKILQSQLESLDNFRQNKDKFENEIKVRDETIEKLKNEYSEAVYSLEKKTVLDQDRMKKEMVTKVNSVAAEFRKVSDIQMAKTTKRAIRENVSIQQQLSKMSGKTLELVHENEELKQTEKEMTRRLEILEFSNEELVRKNVSCQKILRMMRDKAGEREEWSFGLEEKVARYAELEQEVFLAREEAEAQHRETAFFKNHASKVEAHLSSTMAQLSRATAELERLKMMTSNASTTIQDSLKPSGPDQEDQKPQRENLLATLVQLLNFGDHHNEGVLRYMPGDLGIVPPTKLPVKTSSTHLTTELPPISDSNAPLTTTHT